MSVTAQGSARIGGTTGLEASAYVELHSGGLGRAAATERHEARLQAGAQFGADETLVNRDGASAWINVEEATEVAD